MNWKTTGRKLLALLIALVMLLSMVPLSALADFDEYGTCVFCNDWHTICSDCTACYNCAIVEGSHCALCEGCLVGEVDVCPESMGDSGALCVDCCETLGYHCEECGEHVADVAWCPVGGEETHCIYCTEAAGAFYCVSCNELICPLCENLEYCPDCETCMDCLESEYGAAFCEDCGNCLGCMGEDEFCPNCYMCSDCCRICPDCYQYCDRCVETCDLCDRCEDCVTLCDSCLEVCEECADAVCSDCGFCNTCVSAFCLDCGKCNFCAVLCESCGEYCEDCVNICKDCGKCENCVAMCTGCGEYCDGCEKFCEDCGKCHACTTADWCPNCDEFCSDCSIPCEVCGLCENCCHGGGHCILYTMLVGDGQTVEKGKPARFVSSADYDKFLYVYVDGFGINSKYYTVASGSTIVMLSETYTSTLSEGSHTLTILSEDGEVSTTFTVVAEGSIETPPKIDTIEITGVTPPVVGQTANYDAVVPENVEYTYEKESSYWVVLTDASQNVWADDAQWVQYGDAELVFEAGKYYAFVAAVDLGTYALAPVAEVTINGQNAGLRQEDDLLWVDYKFGAPTAPAHTHDFTGAWQHDTSTHWRECPADGAKDSLAAHTPGAAATETTAQTCTVCGYEIKAALGHSHSGTFVAEVPATAETEGTKAHYKCNGCGKLFKDAACTIELTTADLVMPKLAPTLLAGNLGKFVKGSATGLTFRSSAALADFVSVSVDGTVLDASKYTAVSGSTVITLKPEYLGTLSVGDHSLVITSNTGSVSARFSVEAAPSKPGDTDPATYTINTIDGKATNGVGTVITESEAGKTITIKADTAPSGKVFDKWVIRSDTRPVLAKDTDATTTFTMPQGSVTIEATYKDAPTQPTKPQDPNVPKTGDTTNMGLWIGLLLASLAGLIAVVFGKKRLDLNRK